MRNSCDMSLLNRKVLDIQLELCDYCSYNCVMCSGISFDFPHYNGKKGFIKIELIKTLLRNLKENSCLFKRITFQLNWAGEPSLHPQFLEVLRLIYSYSDIIDKIEFHTNCFNFSKQMINELIDIFKNKSIFSQVTFSIDSLNEKIYSRIRVGGNINKVLKTVDLFVKFRKNQDFPRFVYQFIPIEINSDDIVQSIKLISDKYNLKKIIFKPYDRPLDTNFMEDVIYISMCLPADDTNKKFWKKALQNISKEGLLNKVDISNIENEYLQQFCKKNICRHFFETPTITWKGDITFCASDEKLELKIGSINDNKFCDIWFGDKAKKLREKIILGNYPEFCRNNCLY